MNSQARVLSAGDDTSLKEAARILRSGGIVAFPTETVYGLGAEVFDARAVARVFEVKKRPTFDPLIVHVASFEEAKSLWKKVPKCADLLIQKFWPGPLTLVSEKDERVPDLVTAGLTTVAVRMPSHPVALALIRALGSPIAAPSANIFGYTSATTAEAVAEDFGDTIDLILDGGPATVGIESTVLKLEGERGILLRPGGVALEEIEKIIPVVRWQPMENTVLESPGLLETHYAPWTCLRVAETDFRQLMKTLEDYHEVFHQKEIPWPRIGLLAMRSNVPANFFESVEILSASGDLREAAANLFQAVRKLDKMNLDIIVAERVETMGLGAAIMDRLQKASSGNVGVQAFFENLIQ